MQISGESAAQYWQSLKGEDYRRVVAERTANGHASYLAQEVWLENYFREKAKIHNRTSTWPMRVLEIGCGFGRHAAYLSKLDLDYTGFDFSQAMLSAVPQIDRGAFVFAPSLASVPGKFHIALTVSVLIHNTREQVAKLLAGAFSLGVYEFVAVENRKHGEKESICASQEHGGCWQHNYSDIVSEDVAPLVGEPINTQCLTVDGWMARALKEKWPKQQISQNWNETHTIYRFTRG